MTDLYRYTGPTRKVPAALLSESAGPHATVCFVPGQTVHALDADALSRLAELVPPLVELEPDTPPDEVAPVPEESDPTADPDTETDEDE